MKTTTTPAVINLDLAADPVPLQVEAARLTERAIALARAADGDVRMLVDAARSLVTAAEIQAATTPAEQAAIVPAAEADEDEDRFATPDEINAWRALRGL